MNNTELQQIPGGVILTLHGDFDTQAANQIRPLFEDFSQHPEYQYIIIDLSNVEFMDSLGIGALMFLYKRLAGKHRELLLAGINNQPRKAMQALRVDEVLTFHEDVQVCLDVLSIED